MGKAQSKRSVDITTEVKKDDVEEGTGKMEKIEDVDQLKPQINGDTHHTDNETAEKAAEEGTENEKDLSTEKEQQKPQLEGGGDEVAPPSSSAEEKKPIENGDDETLNESKTTTETSVAESSDSSKKMKKEKVKKKWSFRSISFGRKDKQKPPKKDEGVVNGECEKVPEENPEDPAATSKEQTKEEGKSEAPAAASTPSEEKPTTPAETENGKPDEKVDSTLVVNGTEPAKEDSTAQKTAEPAPAEMNKTDIEPVSKQGVEEATKMEEAAKPVEETPQENGKDTVATKIEVKDVKTDVTIDPSVQTESPKPNEAKADGDSDVAQNLPPPPLPCTPPPSQVMVFALSDTEKISDSEQAQIQPPVVEQTVSEKPIEKAPEPAVTESIAVVSPIVEKQSEVPVTENLTPEKISNAEKPSTEEPKSVVGEVVSASTEGVGGVEKQFQEAVGEKQEASSTAEQKIEGDDAPKKTNKDEEVKEPSFVEETKVIEPVVLDKDIKVEGDINPEQIAQTIALIDEVTQAAAAISQTRLEPQDKAPESENKPTETETSCNAPKPEDNSSPPTVPEKTSITDVQVPPVVGPKPVEETKDYKVEENVEKVDEKTKQVDEKVESVEQKPTTTESTDKPKTPEETKTEVVKSTEIVSEVVKPTESQTELKEEKTVEATESAVEQSQTTTECSANVKEIDETGVIPAPVPDAAKVEGHSDSSQAAATKENGIGENHDPSTETTKENLISQPEHKTAEDIKAEQTENKAEVTETTPVAVAE